MWQDYAIGSSQVVFAWALIYTIIGDDKPAPLTSLLTGAACCLLAISFATLNLWWSATMATIVAIEWFIILGQTLLRPQSGRS